MVAGWLYLLSDLSDRLDTGSVQVVVVLSCLDETVVLNVLLHLLSRHHKVIISPIHFVVPLRPRCVYSRSTTAFILRVEQDQTLQTNTDFSLDLRGTQDPNLSGNSEIRSSLIRSFMGPRMMTGRV